MGVIMKKKEKKFEKGWLEGKLNTVVAVATPEFLYCGKREFQNNNLIGNRTELRGGWRKS